MLTVKRKRLWLLLERLTSSIWVELGLMAVLVIVDQVLKWWFQMRDGIVMNFGGILGVFPDFLWLWLLAILWVGMVYYWYGQKRSWNRWSLLLIVAGGLGNLIDRMLFGYVRDFIYYPMWGFYGNLADIWLGMGVLMGVGGSLLLEYKSCKQQNQK